MDCVPGCNSLSGYEEPRDPIRQSLRINNNVASFDSRYVNSSFADMNGTTQVLSRFDQPPEPVSAMQNMMTETISKTLQPGIDAHTEEPAEAHSFTTKCFC